MFKRSSTRPLPALPRTAVLIALSALHLGVQARAEPAPALTNVAPVYLKQGDAREVPLTGQNLAAAASVVIADPRGVGAELVKAEKPDAGAVRVKLSAAADAPLGDREIRVVTPAGVTAPVIVTVGQFPAIAEVEQTGAAAAERPPVALPAVLVGRIDVPGDVDSFRFDAKKGDHLLFDVHAARVGSTLDPVLLIVDSAGREMTRQVDHHDGDPMLVFDVPADGAYTLEVRDLQLRGGGDYAYRIEAGPLPYVESLVPMTGRRGQKVEVTALGHNLAGAEKVTLDLTDVPAGPMPVRVKTATGWSNPIEFLVGETTGATEQEPNDKPEAATPINLPAEATGTLAKEGDEDFYRFTLAAKQTVTIDAIARRIGSPVDALLTLRTGKGDVIDQTNGTPDAEARLSRELDKGDYVVSVRDLTYAGGTGHGYRLSLAQAGALPPDFSVQFLPDAARLNRGNNAKLWCEVKRLNGYKGDVTITLEDLPAGVTVGSGPVVLGEKTSGLFTLSAAADAPLGTFPIKLKAAGALGTQQTVRTGRPEAPGGRVVQAAYLTVLEAGPFAVDAVALLKPEQLTQYAGEVAALVKRLETATPELAAAQAEWEKRVTGNVAWTPLDLATVTSAGGAVYAKQADGSYLASGPNPDKDTLTVVAKTELKGITAIRLEALPDASLPHTGPGRNGDNGNFVLHKFAAAIAKKEEEAGKAKPIVLVGPRATYEQAGYPIAGAVDDNPSTGWAIMGGTGKPQAATFFTQAPVGGDGGSMLAFTLEQQHGQQHTLGRFRLSVATDPDAMDREKRPMPPEVLAALKAPADKRTPEQSARLAAHYRATCPELAADRARLDGLRNSVGPYAEIDRLEKLLSAPSPALEAERLRWEQETLAGAGWTALDVAEVRSANGATLTREPDGSVAASGLNPATDAYTVAASSALKSITAVKLEVLPDERLPAFGPGRAKDGNFVLTRFTLTTAPKPAANPAMPRPPASPDASKPPAAPEVPPATPPVPVELHTPSATFEQPGWPAVGALDERDDTGWAISPNMGRPASVVFRTRSPIAGDGGSALTFTLESAASRPGLEGYNLGRFRLWATGAAQPGDAAAVPDEIMAVLRVPANARNEQQRGDLNAYYRNVAPSLETVRDRLAELRRQTAPLPLVVAKGRAGVIPIPVNRAGGFKGDVTVTLEGYTAGRDAKTKAPAPVGTSLTVTPLTVPADGVFGKLTFRPLATCEPGTRLVVLRAETKVAGESVIQYSPAFPLTVTER